MCSLLYFYSWFDNFNCSLNKISLKKKKKKKRIKKFAGTTTSVLCDSCGIKMWYTNNFDSILKVMLYILHSHPTWLML